MATAQKRGFRFPWGGEPKRDETDDPSLSERLAGALDELGRGPFDLPTDAESVQPEPDAPAAPQTEPAAPTAEADPATVPDPGVGVAGEATAAASAAEVAGGRSPAPAEQSAWPEADRRSTSAPTRDVPAPAPAPTESPAPRRDNPLVTGLVTAMRNAANVAREEAVTSLRADAAAHVEHLRLQGGTAAAELRKAADADVASVREWSKAELARIREETDARIMARKVQLGADIEAAAQYVEDRLAQLAGTVAAFETETAAFFDRLLAEPDPARLAGLAERMPQPPSLDEFAGATAPIAEPQRPLPRSRPVATRAGNERDHEGDLEGDLDHDAKHDAKHDASADAPAGPEALDADGLDADDAAAAEAAALAGLDGRTQLVVSGLVGVGAIAAFKSALLHSDGVSAVSVNAGSDGDILFAVTHSHEADVRTAIQQLEGFQTRVIADDGASLVVVSEPVA